MTNIINLNALNFNEILTKNNNLLVLFFNPSCTHCQKFKPIFEEASKTFKDKITFAECESNQESYDLFKKYEIIGVPTTIFFQNSEIKKKIVGFKSKDELISILNQIPTDH